jgi:hypothetical protein
VLAACVLAWAAPAEADDARGAAGFLVYSIQFVAPNEAGFDVSTFPSSAPRFRIVWSNQIPLGILDSDWTAWETRERDLPLLHHRIVFAIALATADQPPSAYEFASSAVDLRAGYRYRLWHTRGIAPFFGAGASIETTPDSWRASYSPEFGVHLGSDRVAFPGIQLRAQVDLFPSGLPHERLLVTLGYTFL